MAVFTEKPYSTSTVSPSASILKYASHELSYSNEFLNTQYPDLFHKFPSVYQ